MPLDLLGDSRPTPTAAALLPPCPRCQATHVVRNGRTQSGSPNLLCRGCGRRFVAEPKKGPVSDERKELVRRLLLERLSLRGIARATGVSRSWLQGFVNDAVPRGDAVGARAAQKKSGRLILEADEMWSFVGKKREMWWVWVALDAETRQVVAMVAGDRSEFTARCLWDALPDDYRDGAIVFTDFLAAYAAVVPEAGTSRAARGTG